MNYKTFNVYDNGKLHIASATMPEIEEKLGVTPKVVSAYAVRKSVYRKRWTFESTEGKEHTSNQLDDFIAEFTLKWNGIREAYQLINDGKAKVVCENGVRYTKRKPGM